MNHSEFNTTVALFLLLYFIFSISITASTTSFVDNIEVAGQLKEMRLEINQLNRKTGFLELKNVRQDGELRFLKTILTNILNGNDSVKQKRAARLIPLQLLMGRGEEEKPIIGPPTSCKDLNQLGHTLNGIYLIKTNRSTSATNSKIIKAVFCDFQPNSGAQKPSSSPPSFIESRLGYVDVKSAESGIHFYVQIGNRTFPEKCVLRFDNQISNIGGGMNFKTGEFTAPKAGIYTFSYSILKNGYTFNHLAISLRLNGSPIGLSSAGQGLFSVPVTMQSTLKLKKGDRIDLFKLMGEINRFCSLSYCNHFTGLLIEEDLTE